MRSASRPVAAAVAAAAVAVLAGCGGGSGGGSGAGGASVPTPAESGSAVASTVQWWPAGADYCTVLRRTVAHGAGAVRAAGGLPVVPGSTRAFVTAVERAAPGQLAPAWRTIGTALLELVGGASGQPAIRPEAVRRAERLVAADARRRCAVDLGGRQ